MDYKKQNLARLVNYFESNSKEKQLIGLKLEHFVVKAHTWESLTYSRGIKQLLERLIPVWGTPMFFRENIIGIMRSGANINLEPGGQLRISIGPTNGIIELKKVYDNFSVKIATLLEDMGFKLLTVGYRPLTRVDDLPLVPAKRFEIFEEYFKQSGLMGKHMMKGCAATHVSIDYEDECDFKRKFRVANILSPLFAFICDNSKFFEGESFKGRMLRAQIWNNVCPLRTNLVPDCLDKDYGFLDYASYIYEMPAVMIHLSGELSPADGLTFAQFFAERPLEDEDVTRAVSMVFPDVCLKDRIELRVADSLPIHTALAYTALIKGLLYDNFNLDNLYDMTLGVRTHDVYFAKRELIAKGIDGVIYNRPVKDWIKRIFFMSQAGLGSDESPFFLPVEAFTT